MCVRVQKYLMENFLSFSSNKTARLSVRPWNSESLVFPKNNIFLVFHFICPSKRLKITTTKKSLAFLLIFWTKKKLKTFWIWKSEKIRVFGWTKIEFWKSIPKFWDYTAKTYWERETSKILRVLWDFIAFKVRSKILSVVGMRESASFVHPKWNSPIQGKKKSLIAFSGLKNTERGEKLAAVRSGWKLKWVAEGWLQQQHSAVCAHKAKATSSSRSDRRWLECG